MMLRLKNASNFTSIGPNSKQFCSMCIERSPKVTREGSD